MHWALLVGFNYYVDQPILKGAVRDVTHMKQFLEAGSHPVDISMLIAPSPSDPPLSSELEESRFWPTYANVINKMKWILHDAKAGDLVYVHYSGHGSRSRTRESTHHSGNLNLVLSDKTQPLSTYLSGQTLRTFLQKMGEKGLLATIVLDCCFSGSILRTGEVRGSSPSVCRL